MPHHGHAVHPAKKQSPAELNRAYYDEQASQYDDCVFIKARGYREQHDVILSLMAVPGVDGGPIMELGVGTGNLAEKVLERFPSARLDGYDVSEGMLNEARHKLQRYGDRARLFLKDVTTDLPETQYGSIYTSNAVHHLHEKERPRLFHRLFHLLRPGGRLIVCDRFQPETGELAEMYHEVLRRDFAAQGFDLEEVEKEIEHGKHLGVSMSGYTRYIRWMKKAGFVNVDCAWKYLGAAIIHGERPPS